MSAPYTHRIICTIPAPLGVIGAAVGKALDPDVGGDKSFIPVDATYDEDGNILTQPTLLRVDTPCDEQLAQVVPYLLANPEFLLGTIELDFDNRFPEYPRPTLEDVQGFCNLATIEVL